MFDKHAMLRSVIPLIIILMWGINSDAAKSKNILIIANAHAPAYQKTINRFKEILSSHANYQFTIHFLSDTDNKIELINADIKSIEPDLIFALGVASTKIANQATQQIPIITTMIVKSTFFQQASNVTGVVLAYPLKTQFYWIKKVLPYSTNIAILYNPKENQKTIDNAKQIANRMGLKVIAIPVESVTNLPYALEQLSKNVHVLLAISDHVVMNARTAKFVLLASFRNRVPMVGLSDNWVKAGALYALSWDYTSVGEQCGRQAVKVLNGETIKGISVAFPDKIEYTINATIAERMKLELSDSLVINAKAVFK